MIKVIKGDLLKMAKQGDFQLIAHGCNCFNTMGAGIAAGVKNTFPEAFEVDAKTRKGDIAKLGKCSYAKSKNNNNEDIIITNCYSQYDFGSKDGKDPIDYNALDNCLKDIVKNTSNKPVSIGIPMIGYGLAGGKLMPILDIFYNNLKDLDVTIVIYERELNADELVIAILTYIKLRDYCNIYHF